MKINGRIVPDGYAYLPVVLQLYVKMLDIRIDSETEEILAHL